MFNQPHPARAEVPWQPHAGIAQKLSSRGYVTTSWTHDEPLAFAELDYPSKSSGFSAAHYQPTRQPLTQQAQASLALLEREQRNESATHEVLAAPMAEQTHEHLPFVMDDFGATRKSKLRVSVDPKVLKRALAQAELAEDLVVSPITSDDQGPELIVIHPDEPSTDEVLDKTSLQPANAAPEPEVAEEVIKTEPAVVGGIAADEVAQREADQFAKGMAQAREEASVELAAAMAKALAEGFEKGRQEGLEQGLAQGKAQGLDEGQTLGMAQGLEEGKVQGLAEGMAQGREQGLAQGKEQGEQEARDAVAKEMAAQRVVFENVAHELSALIEDPKKFFDPLKRLAIHIAEQVVVGELQTSSKVIERLVQRCLDELDHPVQGAVVLELNPEDKDLLQAQSGEFIQGMRLESVHDMQRGSVRVFANDTVVEDLVNHRLEGLARSLLVDVEAWRDTSPLAQPLLEVQEAEDGDVHS